jgi:hydroxyacylglutathione hydrolase
MLFERIVSKGLAHYSYLVGDKSEAIVIDPRTDCSIYVEKASAEGMRIIQILETHRNEDYVIGSVPLASFTGAQIWHADGHLGYEYGLEAKDGQRWKIGRLEVQAISTPGHTPGSMSYLLRDPGGFPWIVFTGDSLFAGEVGRIDLLGEDRAPEMAGLLYDSIFGRLLPLGDGVLVCPAHGAGSACGESIAERLWTTIGLERMYNPRLMHKTREEFVSSLLMSQPERPPYFTRMEELNIVGAEKGEISPPKPLSPKEFAALIKEGSFVLDTRMELGFASAHIKGAQFIWTEGLASFEGWYVPYNKPLLLVSETNNISELASTLFREGYDNLAGFLAGGMLAWHMAGQNSASIRTLTVQELCRLLDEEQLNPSRILDVRSDKELKRDGLIEGALHIHVTQIPERLRDVPKEGAIYVFCGSGMRSMVAASFLQRNGWENLAIVLGGMAGWRSLKCPIAR